MSEINKLEERFELLNSDELVQIQQEYRKKRLKETLMGPLISTAVHLLLIFAVSFFRGEVKKQNPQIVITQKVIEAPDKPVEPEPLPKKLDEPIFEEIENPLNPSDSVVDEIPMIEDEQVEEPPAVDEVQDFDFPGVLKPSTSTLISTSEYLLRSPKEKQKARRTHSALEGGTKSLLKALDWLAKNQRPDGSWGNSGVTGLALLAFLANGDTPQSKRYGKTVGNAIKWLASSSPGASLVDLNHSHSGIQIVGISELTQKDFAYYAGGEVSGTGVRNTE